MYCVLVCVCGVVCDVWCGVWCGVPTVESRFTRNIFGRIRLCVVGDEKKIMRPDRGGSRTSRNVVRSITLRDVRLRRRQRHTRAFFLETFHKM